MPRNVLTDVASDSPSVGVEATPSAKGHVKSYTLAPIERFIRPCADSISEQSTRKDAQYKQQILLYIIAPSNVWVQETIVSEIELAKLP